MSGDLGPGYWRPERGIQVWVPQRFPPPSKPMFCGTERGYQWHRHNDRGNWPLPEDDPCNCRAAHAAWWHFRKRMRAEQTEEVAA